MTPPTPPVSVVMAVRNGERTVGEAVRSILAQDHRDFEFIVIDDASTDATSRLLAAIDDARVSVLRNERQCGLARSLNRALHAARGTLIARIDADDIAEPRRLARQIRVFREAPDVAVVGSWTTEIDDHGHVIGAERLDPDPGLVRWWMSHANAVYHSTVLARRDALLSLGGYDPEFRYAQDHELWTRVLLAGWRVTLVPEPLVRYRRSTTQVTARHADQQLESGVEVRRRYCAALTGRDVGAGTIRAMLGLLGWPQFEAPADPGSALALMQAVRRACQRATPDSAHAIAAAFRRLLLAQAKRWEASRPMLAAELARHAASAGPLRLADARALRSAAGVQLRALGRRIAHANS